MPGKRGAQPKKNRATPAGKESHVEAVESSSKRGRVGVAESLAWKAYAALEKSDTTELLRLAKQRFKLATEGPAFIGAANLANYWWCAEKSRLNAVKEEPAFFMQFLLNRLSHSLKLGQVRSVPNGPDGLLEIGSQLTASDIERVLELRSIEVGSDSTPEIERIPPGAEFVVESHLSEASSPISRGGVAEDLYARKYPSLCWHGKFGDYIVVGVPDGITKDFVYEFKSTTLDSIIHRTADIQADIYGTLFGRNEKVVEILHLPDKKVESVRSPVNLASLNRTLDRASRVYSGRASPIPPQPWKCRNCEYLQSCTVTTLKSGSLPLRRWSAGRPQEISNYVGRFPAQSRAARNQRSRLRPKEMEK
jgi:CRISPR/Cas system-associated exonuclease Cas4 (RecB family)